MIIDEYIQLNVDLRKFGISILQNIIDIMIAKYEGVMTSISSYALAMKLYDNNINPYNILIKPTSSLIELGIQYDWIDTLIDATTVKLEEIDKFMIINSK